MNDGTALYTWNGFSIYDIIAIQALYPYGQYDKWLTSPECKYSAQYGEGYSIFVLEPTDLINITWNQNLVNTAGITLSLYQNGQYVRTLANNIANTGSYSTPIASYLAYSGNHTYTNAQIKIQSGTDSNISDFSSMFYIRVD